MKVKTAKFNNIRYDIDLCGPIDGSCDYPRSGRPSIRITTELYSKAELEALLHETLHASDWSKSEEIVSRIAKEQARLLWRLGYRRQAE